MLFREWSGAILFAIGANQVDKKLMLAAIGG
jgi:hypothetical protein